MVVRVILKIVSNEEGNFDLQCNADGLIDNQDLGLRTSKTGMRECRLASFPFFVDTARERVINKVNPSNSRSCVLHLLVDHTTRDITTKRDLSRSHYLEPISKSVRMHFSCVTRTKFLDGSSLEHKNVKAIDRFGTIDLLPEIPYYRNIYLNFTSTFFHSHF